MNYDPNLQIGGKFIDDYYSMVSGQAIAQENHYNIIIGKSGRIWLYQDGDSIYVQGGPNSDGFGGATLEFKLRNGCDSVKLKGAWHSNSGALYSDTRIDLRNQHLTWGVIGKKRSSDNGRSVIEDILWFDKEPIYGPFDRVNKLANEMSHRLKTVLYYYSRSRGGSSCGPMNWKEYAKAN